jgi:hypothetical protein
VKPGQVAREDYQYERNGSAVALLAYRIDTGERYAEIRPQRTKQDYAQFVQAAIDVLCPDVPRVAIVNDNLNTHTAGAFYAAFDAATARHLVQRIDWHYTPKHASSKGVTKTRKADYARLSGRIERANTNPTWRMRMSTFRLYDSTQAALRERLPLVLPSQRTNLALLVTAAAHAQSCHLADLARALPLPTLQASKVQRIRRLLDNDRITLDTHYRPVVRQAVQGVRGQQVDVILDRVRLKNRQNVVVGSLGFRRRAVPLAWAVLDHLGSSNSDLQIAVLEQALPSLPPGVQVTLHGDAEFCTTALFRWARKRGWHAILGLQSSTHLHFSTRPTEAGRSIAAYYGERRGVLYVSQVYVTEERFGPVNLIMWWDGDTDEPVRAVMTDLPANGFTFQRGRRRMWIETLFRDWQSSGFHLDQTGLVSHDRFDRLLIVLALAYLLFLSVGRWVVKRSYRRLIDDGVPRAWHYSLFQLGVGWLIYCQSNGHSIPVILSLYP